MYRDAIVEDSPPTCCSVFFFFPVCYVVVMLLFNLHLDFTKAQFGYPRASLACMCSFSFPSVLVGTLSVRWCRVQIPGIIHLNQWQGAIPEKELMALLFTSSMYSPSMG